MSINYTKGAYVNGRITFLDILAYSKLAGKTELALLFSTVASK
jgi:hypothetical protein